MNIKCIWLLTIAMGFFGSTLAFPDLPGIFAFRVFFFLHLVLFGAMLLIQGKSVWKDLFPVGIRLYLVFLALWFIWALGSLIWAENKYDAMRHIFYLFTGLGLSFFTVYYTRDKSYFRSLFYTVFASVAVVMLVGLWETLTGNHLPISLLYGETRTWLNYKATSFFHNPNDFATMLALYLPIVYGIMRIGPNIPIKLGASVSILVGLYLLLVTMSRANMIALCFACLGMLFLFLSSAIYRSRFNGYIWMAGTALISLVIIFGLVLGGVLPDYQFLELKPLQGLYKFGVIEANSVVSRVDLLRAGAIISQEHFLLGVGAGNAEHHMLQYTDQTWGLINMHNWWAEVLINYGIIIFLLYLVFFISIILALYRNAITSPDRDVRHMSSAIFMSMCAFPVAVTSSSTMAGMNYMWLLFALALAVINYSILTKQLLINRRHPVQAKNVLMISHIFPPVGGVGVLRLVKFCKYLPQQGWGINVLTPRRKESTSIDSSLLEEIPGEVMVTRTWHLDFAVPYRWVKPLFIIPRRLILKRFQVSDGGTPSVGAEEALPRSGYRRLMDLLFIPDEGAGWLVPAFLSGLALTEQRRIDIIYSTAPQYSTHIIGLLIKKVTGKPWIADFRDPWVGNSFVHFPTRIHLFIHKLLEKAVVNNADQVLTISQGLNDALRENYPTVPENKFITLNNGYDAADFTVEPAALPQEKLIFIHTGTFYRDKNPGSFLTAMTQACDMRPGLRDKVQVYFVGHGAAPYVNLAEELGLAENVQVVGYVSHLEAIGYIKAAHVALLIPGGDRTATTGKVFQYLAAEKPILTIANQDNGVFAVLDQLNEEYRHYSASPSDVVGLRDIICLLYDQYIAGELRAPPGDYGQYDRERQAAKLSQIMDPLTGYGTGEQSK